MYDFIFQDKDNLPMELKTLKVAFADSMQQVCVFVSACAHVCVVLWICSFESVKRWREKPTG